MADCNNCNFPVMISFHNFAGSLSSFKLVQVEKSATFESILKVEGADVWDESSLDNINVKVSAARSGCYDKFGLNKNSEN